MSAALRSLSRCCTIVVLAALASPTSAHGIEQVDFDDGRSVSAGALARTGLIETRGAPSPALAFESAVLLLSAQLHPALRLQLDAIALPTASVQIVDAILELEPATALKLWAGLLLPASDRVGLTGPYFSALWDAPFIANYPGTLIGRSPGATLWGRLFDERLRYQVGAYQGLSGAPGPLASARLQLDLLDREPGYYTAGTYVGERRLVSLGIGGRSQDRGAGGPRAFSTASVDLFVESPVGRWGVATVEAALLYFDLGGATSPALLSGPAGEVTLAWILPVEAGPLRLQPTARWQDGRTGAGTRHDRVDLGLNGFALGQTLRVSLDASAEDAPARTYRVQLGAQLLL